MEEIEDWIETEISQELSKLTLKDLEDPTEKDYSDLFLKLKPPSIGPVCEQFSCLNRYVFVRKNLNKEIYDELKDCISTEEKNVNFVERDSIPPPPVTAVVVNNGSQLEIEDEEQNIETENDLLHEIQVKEMALLSVIEEKEKFELELKKQEKMEREIKSSVTIQSYWRSYRVRLQIVPAARREKLKWVEAVVSVQRKWREYKLRQLEKQLNSSARKIQLCWRHYKERVIVMSMLNIGRRLKEEKEILERKKMEERLKEENKKLKDEETLVNNCKGTSSQELQRSCDLLVQSHDVISKSCDQLPLNESCDQLPNKSCDQLLDKSCDQLPSNESCDQLPNKSCDQLPPNESCDQLPNKSCDQLPPNESCDQLPDKSCDQLPPNESCDQTTDTELAQMIALKERRSYEEMTARISRDRMNQLMSHNEIVVAMETRRSEPDYKMRLEHSSSPLSYYAWQGVIEERRKIWQSKRGNINLKRTKGHVVPCTPYLHPSQEISVTKPLSNAQLLAASPQGTTIDQVTVVHIYKCRNGSIDFASLSKCPNLRSLSLINCSLVSFKEVGGANPLLQEITLSSNALELINCSKLPTLRFLDLSDNKLSSIHGLQFCKDLLELNFDENRIARIGGLENCKQLQYFSANGNLIINSTGVASLSNLQHLSLAENHLPVVNGLESCLYLQFVDVQQNNLQESISVSNNVLLCEINLSGNSISDIAPIEEAWLPHLQTLRISNNCITCITSLTCCIMLSLLDVCHNSLYDLSAFLQSIRGCYHLTHLYIDGNPITHEPKLKHHLSKALPNLALLDDIETHRKKNYKLPKEIISHPLVQLVNRQQCEQDELKKRQNKVIENLCNEGSTSPAVTAEILDTKISHHIEYHNLLKQHLTEHIQFDGQFVIQPTSEIKTNNQKVKNAAIIIQKYWRGHACRKWYSKLINGIIGIQSLWRGYQTRKMYTKWLIDKQTMDNIKNRAAVVIQSCFRGYILRKKLREILSNVSYFSNDDEINIEEISFDESIISDDVIKPLSPTDEEIDKLLRAPMTPPPAPLLDKQTVPKLTVPGAIEEEVPLREWLAEESRVNNAMKRSSYPHSTYKQTIMNEWGFENPTTVELMMKRAGRHKKLQRTARQRIRLSDPSERFSEFQKACSKAPLPAVAAATVSRDIERKELMKSSDSNTTYQWVHRKKLIHQQLLSGPTTPTSRSSSLPYMELHVLAGHTPRLITSKAQNELVRHQTKSLKQAWN